MKTLPYNAAEEFTRGRRTFRRSLYLLVRNNSACGGVNVSFFSFYRCNG